MKTVTIPDYIKPNWECTIAGKKYSYPSGTSQSVPDSVAELIVNERALMPKELPMPGKVGQVLTRTETGYAWVDVLKELPEGSLSHTFLRYHSMGLAWVRLDNITLGATTSKYGLVKKGTAVANATNATDVITQLNALIASLVAAGSLTEYVEPTVQSAGSVGGDDAGDGADE